jgi:Rieske Fe-S protein
MPDMDRRNFIKGSCGLCVAMSSGLLLGAILESCHTALKVVKATAQNNIITVPLDSFKESNFQLLRVSNYDDDIALQKAANGTYSALVLRCTHAGEPVRHTGDTFYCSAHGSRFSATGAVITGPAEEPLKELATRTDAANIYITLSV